ncbi:MAG TPA: TonB-dependent receptor [Opitutaceae bacterium]|jgi:outer membrane receptor protein involved in Fe transport|nr:TonB-dependent receptor [Opitutaceae bacterium]
MNHLCGYFAVFAVVSLVHAQTVIMDPVVVTAARAPLAASKIPLVVDVFTAEALQQSPSLAIDDALRRSPAFSLFRRSGSLTANPTAQGVSLRGIGPSGASRSLVLLDGVPLNDPFGGWVTWSKLSMESLSRVEMVHGGGSGAWGNSALGGTIQLIRSPLDRNEVKAVGAAGDFSTWNGEILATGVKGKDSVRVDADDFSTTGFPLVAPNQRGPIDVNADVRHRWAEATWQHEMGNSALSLNGRYFTEDRDNGTPLQRNATVDRFVSAKLVGVLQNGPAWSAVSYVEQESFNSYFTSVNAARTAETPADDQFAVPADAAGGSLTATWSGAGRATTSVGADARWVKGETREDTTFSNGKFTQQLFAGGEQYFTGAFLQHEQALSPEWRGTLGARVDYWRNDDGHQRKSNLITGASLQNSEYAAMTGKEFSPNVGLIWQPCPWGRARLDVYHAFRVPTLNEYYRPYRVGNVITAANPALSRETINGAETGFDFGGEPAGASLTGFYDELYHAVSNVNLVKGPGTFPLFGVIPAGGVGQQRLNLDAVQVRGLEASVHWQPISAVRLEAAYLYNDTRITAASVAPTLVGKRLAEVPRHSVVLTADWLAPAQIHLDADLHWTSSQFDDDQNRLKLASATTFNISASRKFGKSLEVFFSVENLFNAQVQTGLSPTGVVSVGPPRFTRGGLRWMW